MIVVLVVMGISAFFLFPFFLFLMLMFLIGTKRIMQEKNAIEICEYRDKNKRVEMKMDKKCREA